MKGHRVPGRAVRVDPRRPGTDPAPAQIVHNIPNPADPVDCLQNAYRFVMREMMDGE